MKLYNRYIQYTIFLAVILSVSCKKLVEIDEPIDTVTSNKIFNSDEQASQTLSGLYSLMVGDNTGPLLLTFGGTGIYGGLAADELLPNNLTANVEDNQIYYNNALPDNSILEGSLWNSTYKVIYTANAILDGEANSTSDKLTQAKRNELKASAKFVRSLCFFYLTNFYGEIPLPLSSSYQQNAKLTKSSSEAVYAQLIADLKEAVALFPQSTAKAAKKNMANQQIAEALLARVYLYAKDYNQAALCAGNVINSGNYSLGTLEQAFLDTNNEAIFQLSINSSAHLGSTRETAFLVPPFPLYMLSPSDQAMFLDPSVYESVVLYLTPNYGLTDDLINAFEPGDERKTVWTNFNGSPNVSPYNGKKYYFSNKYPRNDIDQTAYVIIRLAEMYLIRAEALAMQNKTADALLDLNKIRNRAGLANSTATNQSTLLTAIAHERQTELFTEWGHRFFDLKRTGKALEVLSKIPEKSAINNNKLVFPIPTHEIIANPKLIQNPGY